MGEGREVIRDWDLRAQKDSEVEVTLLRMSRNFWGGPTGEKTLRVNNGNEDHREERLPRRPVLWEFRGWGPRVRVVPRHLSLLTPTPRVWVRWGLRRASVGPGGNEGYFLRQDGVL